MKTLSAFKVPMKLGRTGANLALAAYGTTQSLQVLRRNLNLKPKLVIYTLISDHLRRNVSSCAPSFLSVLPRHGVCRCRECQPHENPFTPD